MVDQNHQLPPAPIEILNSAAAIVEQLQPEIASYLGDKAVVGSEEGSQVWVDSLADAADRMQRGIDVIYSLINRASEDPDSSIIDVAGDDSSVIEVFIDHTAPADPELEQVPKTLEEVLDELGLTANERLGINSALELLKTEPGNRFNINSIMRHAFGRRLPKDEEDRLRDILIDLKDYGIVSEYGKAYAFESEISMGKKETIDPLLDEEDVGLIKYICSQPDDAQVNIAKIIREYFGINTTLSEEEFQALSSRLNRLASLGYLSHSYGSSWYGPGVVSLPKERQRSSSYIQTPAVITTSVTQTEADSNRSNVMATSEGQTNSRSEPLEDGLASEVTVNMNLPSAEELGLTERETLMYSAMEDLIKSGEWFSQGNIDFSSIEFSSKDALKQACFKLTAKLMSAGVLEHNGKRTGGSKYRGIPRPVTEQAPVDEPDPEDTFAPIVELRQQVPQSRTSRIMSEIRDKREQKKEEERRAKQFTGRIVTFIQGIISETGKDSEAISTIRRRIMNELGVDEEVASTIITNAVFSGGIYKTPGVKGSVRISLVPPPESGKQPQHEAASTPSAPTEWKDLDEIILRALLAELAELTPQELETGIDLTGFERFNEMLAKLNITPTMVRRVARIGSSAGVFRAERVTVNGESRNRSSHMIVTVDLEQKAAIKDSGPAVVRMVREHATNEPTAELV